jgi:hypothetical protein
MIRPILIALTLTTCAATAPGVRAPAGGTAVVVNGEVCGKGINISLADINDRGGFNARCTYDTATGIAVPKPPAGPRAIALTSSDRAGPSPPPLAAVAC